MPKPWTKNARNAIRSGRESARVGQMRPHPTLAALVDIDMAVIRELIEQIFASKPKLVPANMQAIEAVARSARLRRWVEGS